MRTNNLKADKEVKRLFASKEERRKNRKRLRKHIKRKLRSGL